MNYWSRLIFEPPTNHDIFRELSSIIIFYHSRTKFFIRLYNKEQQAFHTNLLNVQQGEQPLFTKLKSMRMLRVLFVAQSCFLTNVHAPSVMCTQLFPGKSTNAN